jgi:hypothetical protein
MVETVHVRGRGGMGGVDFTIILNACMALVEISFYFENQRFCILVEERRRPRHP